jgi:hypothetical protein
MNTDIDSDLALLNPRRARERRDAAFGAAVTAISRNVPDLPGLAVQLEVAGGCGRLVKALRRVSPKRQCDVGGSPQPDQIVWSRAGKDWRFL